MMAVTTSSPIPNVAYSSLFVVWKKAIPALTGLSRL
jgi:hypothetical protein